MSPVHVSAHACERYVERVQPSATVEQARALIAASEAAILAAARFGCSRVKLGCGARLVLAGTDVVTVLAPTMRGGMR